MQRLLAWAGRATALAATRVAKVVLSDRWEDRWDKSFSIKCHLWRMGVQ
jgi:hypothetical protein